MIDELDTDQTTEFEDFDFSNFIDFILLVNELFTKAEIEKSQSTFNIDFSGIFAEMASHEIFTGMNSEQREASLVNYVKVYLMFNNQLIEMLEERLFGICNQIEANSNISLFNFMYSKISKSIIYERNIEKKYIYLNKIKMLFEQNRPLLRQSLAGINVDELSVIMSMQLILGMIKAIFPKKLNGFDFEGWDIKFSTNLDSEIEVLNSSLSHNIRIDSTTEFKSLTKPKGIIPKWKGTDSELVELVYFLQETKYLEVVVEDTDNRNKGIELVYMSFFELFNVKYKRNYSSIIDNIKRRTKLEEVTVKFGSKIKNFKNRFTNISNLLEKASE